MTKTINIDLAILKKYYNDEIPKNLEEASTLFSEIIGSHYERFKYKETSTAKQLSSHLAKLGDISRNSSDQNTVQLLYKKKSKSSGHIDLDNICTEFTEMASPTKIGSTVQQVQSHVPLSRKQLFLKEKTNVFFSEWDPIPNQSFVDIQS